MTPWLLYPMSEEILKIQNEYTRELHKYLNCISSCLLWFFLPITILNFYSIIHHVSFFAICEFNIHNLKGSVVKITVVLWLYSLIRKAHKLRSLPDLNHGHGCQSNSTAKHPPPGVRNGSRVSEAEWQSIPKVRLA